MIPLQAVSQWHPDYRRFECLKRELQRQMAIIERGVELRTSEASWDPSGWPDTILQLHRVAPGSTYHHQLKALANLLSGLSTIWNNHRHLKSGFDEVFALLQRVGPIDLLGTEVIWRIPAFCEPLSQYINVKAYHESSKEADAPNAYNEDFWDSDELFDWASSENSSILLVEGDYQCDFEIGEISRDLIQYLIDHNEPTVWIPGDPTISANMSHANHILKQLAVQILQKNNHLHHLPHLSHLVEMFLMSPGSISAPQNSKVDWFDVLQYVLRGISNLCMVVDLRVLDDNHETASSWIDTFSSLFDRLRLEESAVLKIALLSTWPMPKGTTEYPTIIVNSQNRPPNLQRIHRIQQFAQNEGTRSLHFSTKKPSAESRESDHQTNYSSITMEEHGFSFKVENTVGSVSGAKGATKRGPADWFTQMKSFEKTVDASRKEPDAAHPRIKIAVLDTGLDLSHCDIIKAKDQGRLRYRDFVTDTDTIKDDDGHGTHCTYLALKYAPNAEIFAGRVFRKSEADTDSFSILTKAIRYAAEVWKVDIISLSLGFTNEQDSDLRKEIRKASANNILIFASAANNTSNEVKPTRFPASMNDVICIFSSNSYGRPSDFNPRAHYSRPNLTFPGEEIRGAWPAALASEKTFELKGVTYKNQSGTSCATPIAAAVAASVLEFVAQEREPAVRRAELLRHYTGMTRVWMRLMVDDFKYGDNSYNYVKPWMLISEYCSKAEISGLVSHTLDKIDG